MLAQRGSRRGRGVQARENANKEKDKNLIDGAMGCHADLNRTPDGDLPSTEGGRPGVRVPYGRRLSSRYRTQMADVDRIIER